MLICSVLKHPLGLIGLSIIISSIFLIIVEFFDIRPSLALLVPHHPTLQAADNTEQTNVGGEDAISIINDVPTKNVSIHLEEHIEERAGNATLGFAKIIALSLPERTDRRDALFLMSKYQDIKLDWMTAIKGEDISRKGLPPGYSNGIERNVTLGEAGCWRSHMNALQMVIEEGLQSALIIEDDVDWDVQLKEQMQSLAQASRKLDDDLRDSDDPLDSQEPTGSPYGEAWDLLRMGICLNPPLQAGSRFQTFVSEYGQTHYVYPPEGQVMCTYAYAVTAKSAKTLFGYLQNSRRALDEDLNIYCQKMECRIVWPQLISSRSFGRDSDIRKEPSDEDVMDPELGTWNIRNSAIVDMLGRNNID